MVKAIKHQSLDNSLLPSAAGHRDHLFYRWWPASARLNRYRSHVHHSLSAASLAGQTGHTPLPCSRQLYHPARPDRPTDDSQSLKPSSDNADKDTDSRLDGVRTLMRCNTQFNKNICYVHASERYRSSRRLCVS